MFTHAVMRYWVREYVMDTYVCEKCKFTLFIDYPSYFVCVCVCVCDESRNALVMPVLAVAIDDSKRSAQWRTSNQELGRVLPVS
jgi:hypothetical protein